jgi:hypothetical protein
MTTASISKPPNNDSKPHTYKSPATAPGFSVFRSAVMPAYTIETTYTLPIFRHGTYIADTPEAACKVALGDDNWESLKKDYDSSGEIHVTGIWEGENTAHAGSPITVPSQFEESVRRRARHFEILLGLLKMLFHDVQAGRSP